MDQVSVIKEGVATYFVANGDALREFARIAVPDTFSPEQAATLGLNVMGATWGRDLPGHVAPVAAKAVALGPPVHHPEGDGAAVYEQVAELVAAQPGMNRAAIMTALGITSMAAVASALKRAREHGLIHARGQSHASRWFPGDGRPPARRRGVPADDLFALITKDPGHNGGYYRDLLGAATVHAPLDTLKRTGRIENRGGATLAAAYYPVT